MSPKNIWIRRIRIQIRIRISNTASSFTKNILLYLEAELELGWILAGVQVALQNKILHYLKAELELGGSWPESK
jgi:hypothetical protein